MNDIRDLFPGRMRERAFQLKARRDTGVAWHEPQFVECKQCGRRATRQIWAKSLFVCPNCGNHQPIGAYYRLSLVLDSGSFRELDYKLSSHYFTNSPYNQIFFCLFLCLFLLFQDKRKKVVTQM